MSNSTLEIDVAAWVKRAKADPIAYQQRQTVEITLNAIAIATPFYQKMFLKGGILMGLAYDSPRQTIDIDLTTSLNTKGNVDDRIRKQLDSAFPRASAALGYAGLIVKVHSVKRLPAGIFATAEFPALKLKIASARRGTNQEKALLQGRAPQIVGIDISFNEPLRQTQVLKLTGGNELYAYGKIELIAEKYRSLLQQVPRKRNRRQDVFDLDRLINDGEVDGASGADILDVFLTKCHSRHLAPSAESLNDPEIKRRAGADWNTIKLEVGEVADFEVCFGRVRDYYRSLPWQDTAHKLGQEKAEQSADQGQ